MTSVSTDRRFGVNAGMAIKVPCKVATTANITLSGEQTIDGVSCVEDDRVLVRSQTTSSENGIYYVKSSAWERTPDFDDPKDITEGTLIPVNRGSTYTEAVFRVDTTGTITPGTTSITFSISSFFFADEVTLVPNVAQMRLLSPENLARYYLKGHTTEGVGFGPFRGITGAAAGTYVDNGGTIIVPTGGNGSAAFLREFSGKINVRWFGATGDGVTDDSVSIQGAINYASYGDSIYFTSGTYSIRTQLSVGVKSGDASGITFIGDGLGSIIEPGAAITNVFYITGTDTKYEYLNIANNSSYATNGLNFSMPNSASFSSRINNCNFTAFTNGIVTTGQQYNISNCYFQNNSVDIKSSDDFRNSVIDNNFSLGSGTNIKLLKTSLQAEGVRITNNTFLPTAGSGSGIEISDGLEIVIDNNVIDQCGSGTKGIYLGTGTTSRIKITNNWIDAGNTASGLISTGTNGELIISNNSFTGSAGSVNGISLTNTNTVKMISNNFLGSLTTDYSSSGVVTQTIFGNTSSISGSNIQDYWPRTWNTYTPTITATAGAFTTVSATGRYWRNGSVISIEITITITTNGTAASAVLATLPVASKTGIGYISAGRENAISGSMCQALISGSSATITTYNNNYPGADGAVIFITGTYEAD